MAVWPFLMGFAAILTLWGWRHEAWVIPVLALCGYVAMRLNISLFPQSVNEIVGCALWLFIAAIMVYKGGAVPGLFFCLSALTYPALLVFGFKIEYMGLAPVIADSFAILAMLTIGGGLYGLSDSRGDNHRILFWLKGHSLGVALCEKGDHRGVSHHK
ncbi:MAG: hypothetical protein ACPG4X_21240 [Pikeienuella sp.]